MPKPIFAVNGPNCWYQLKYAYRGWWCGSQYKEKHVTWEIRPVSCCALPGKLFIDWFDSLGFLPVNAKTWEPEQYSPSARVGGRVEGLGVQKRPWVRRSLSNVEGRELEG